MHQPQLPPRFGLLLLASLALGAAAQAQAPVHGTLQDAAGQPLPFATAVLLHLPDSSVASVQTADAQGAFRFETVAAGPYCLKALLLGYRPQHYGFTVTDQPLTLPALRLPSATTALAEVVVEGRPPVLEQHADRTVVNVDRLNTAGDNALEVLRRAPGVTLDKDDQVQYRGSGSVLVLIDGKQTYMSGAALSNYLKSLPASAISQIELLPNPPASLDAAGTAGVINLRTRRSLRPGLTGTATATGGYGRYEKGSGGLNLAYNAGRLRTFGRVDLTHSNSFNNLDIRRQIRDTTFAQQKYWHPVYNGLNYAAGVELPLSPRQTLGGQVRGALDRTTALSTGTSMATAPDGRPVSTVSLYNPSASRSTDRALNLNYRLALDSTGRELTADADLIQYRSRMDQSYQVTSSAPAAAGALGGQQRSDQGADVVIRALKADYVHPAAGGWRAEAGAKTSWVTTCSFLNFEQLLDEQWQLDAPRTDRFRYDEIITAGYATLGTTWRGLELKAGLRGEHTHSVGASATTGQRVVRNYFQLFPTLFASYKIGEHDQLGLSAGRRISRPSYQSLNPFVTYTDAYTALQGNPFLAPSLARSLVLNYAHRNFQVLSLSYLLETNVVSQVAYQNDQTKVTTTVRQNLDRALTLTLTSGGHTDVSPAWGMDNELEGSYNAVTSRLQGQPVQLRRFALSASSNHTVRLPRGYQVLVNGSYGSPSVQGLFYTRSYANLTLGAKKLLWRERATLSLRLSDVFGTSRFRSIMDYNNIRMSWNNQWESRRLSLSFTCKLGSGSTHTGRTRGSADEESRAGH
ncbi:outer membrane beta-barrel protein [Hymenobacter sp. 15J16-1T3B]|uniref:outer membrane beta-barrel protein n=1 Tax=Hymenobacter sp. 15J16-1T3B TaxID=2886941 RepID=UPI001D0FE2BD|nr:outer membrane beta-barrel protein [Hymenobacter sp. 15J16-1T3B]MCC3157065.1 outer membrane beta-barrel protein [Hymenobacter sp. 15J16-1T3B]